MIKINHEVPIQCLGQTWFNDYEYALAHNFDQPGYADYFRAAANAGRTVYLDNSAFELGGSVDLDYLVQCWRLIDDGKKGAWNSWVFLPDVPGDAQRTLELSREAARCIGAEIRARAWGVIQGKTNEELDACLREMVGIADGIAIPYRIPDRGGFIKRNLDFLRDKFPDIHLLGLNMMADLKPVFEVAGALRNISIDTSLPVVTGLKRIALEPYTKKPQTQVWHIKASTLPQLVYENARRMRTYIESEGARL